MTHGTTLKHDQASFVLNAHIYNTGSIIMSLLSNEVVNTVPKLLMRTITPRPRYAILYYPEPYLSPVSHDASQHEPYSRCASLHPIRYPW